MRTIADLTGVLDKYSDTDGMFQTPIPRLTVTRYSRPTTPELVLYEPALCVVAQGSKESGLDTQVFRYDAARYLLGSVQLPVFGSVIEATKDKPFLCLRFDFDTLMIAEFLQQLKIETGAEKTHTGLELGEMDAVLIDTVTRLTELIYRPNEIPVLAPLVEKELLWRLLQNKQSATMLGQMVSESSRLRGLAKVVEWLRDNFAEQTTIEELASIAGMSLSSFHEHFKAVTGTSPLRFRSRLRLMRAKQLMMADGYGAAEAGHMVGYKEPAQFSREYAKLFGLPPKRDSERLKV